MADLSLTELFLNGMATYGPLSLGLALLLDPLGVPVPTSLLALARRGLFPWTPSWLWPYWLLYWAMLLFMPSGILRRGVGAASLWGIIGLAEGVRSL